ncbi:MAG: hypothetical protein GXP27_05395 [Planctomycetes bacterium]|nr:hypothetical protein [Planctomycetota bacterium]
MKYVLVFHANLNYAYLVPERYEFVIRSAYELILDTMREHFPGTKYVFEASGYTIEQIAEKTPDVLEKLKQAVAQGDCELMGSPYAHPMLPNFPMEDGLRSVEFSNRVYRKHFGFRPRSFWNPECGWRGFLPELVLRAGYRNLIGDFEAYSRSLDPDGRPLRPEIYAKEHSDDPAFYHFGFAFDLPGIERAIHFPFERIAGAEPGRLRVFLRTDRVAQFGVRFFMGMEGYTLEKYLALIRKYSEQAPGEPEGALIIFADDAEYVGTNGWFRLKYQNEPDHVFERTDDAQEKLISLVTECRKLGEFITFDEACNSLPALNDLLAFDDDSAWHGARASTWAATPMARLLRPWQDLVREKLKAVQHELDNDTVDRAWFHLTNSYNSDGQWPPTLPEAPHIVHPFNYAYCFDNLLAAELLAGGVDRSRLETDPAATVQEILGPQQELVLCKAGDNALVRQLIERSRDVASIRTSGAKVLYPSEYRVRADALVEARRLVGGIEIEKATTDLEET